MTGPCSYTWKLQIIISMWDRKHMPIKGCCFALVLVVNLFFFFYFEPKTLSIVGPCLLSKSTTIGYEFEVCSGKKKLPV